MFISRPCLGQNQKRSELVLAIHISSGFYISFAQPQLLVIGRLHLANLRFSALEIIAQGRLLPHKRSITLGFIRLVPAHFVQFPMARMPVANPDKLSANNSLQCTQTRLALDHTICQNAPDFANPCLGRNFPGFAAVAQR